MILLCPSFWLFAHQCMFDYPDHRVLFLLGLFEQGLDVAYYLKQALGAVGFSTNAR